MQHCQSGEFYLTSSNTSFHPTSNHTADQLIPGTPVFVDELAACLDCLLQCAFHNKSWNEPLLRMSKLLGAEQGLIEVTGTQPFYAASERACVKQDAPLAPYVIQAKFEAVAIHLCLNFRETINEQTSPSLATILAIEQHLHRCLMVMVWRWRAADTLTQLHALVGALSAPCALVDHDNQLICINSAGRAIFGLQSEEPWIDSPNWRAALARAKSDVSGQTVFWVGENSFAFRAIRLGGSLGNATLASDNLHLIEISKARCGLTQALELVQQRYNLSKNESAVLSIALEGDDIDQIAKRRRVSRETIRAQLRSCRAKTGTNSLFQLIGLVHSILTEQQPKNRTTQLQTHILDHSTPL